MKALDILMTTAALGMIAVFAISALPSDTALHQYFTQAPDGETSLRFKAMFVLWHAIVFGPLLVVTFPSRSRD